MDQDHNKTVLNVDALPMAREIILSFGGNDYVITVDRTPFIIGRDDSCDLQINSSFASRQHCKVLHHQRNFILKDCSTNGTFVRNGSAHPIQLNDSLTSLTGSGIIKLGEKIKPGETGLILFKAVY